MYACISLYFHTFELSFMAPLATQFFSANIRYESFNSIYSQTRSSVPPKNALMNLLIKS